MTDFVVSVKTDALGDRISNIRMRLVNRLLIIIQRLAIKLQTHVKEDKLTGQVLKVRTGTLRRSINQQVSIEPNRIMASVGTNVEYAAIHEFGGVIPSHVVEAINAKALRFMPKGGSDFIFRKRVVIPDVIMPERSFLRSALRDMEQEIIDALAGEAKAVIQYGR